MLILITLIISDFIWFLCCFRYGAAGVLDAEVIHQVKSRQVPSFKQQLEDLTQKEQEERIQKDLGKDIYIYIELL